MKRREQHTNKRKIMTSTLSMAYSVALKFVPGKDNIHRLQFCRDLKLYQERTVSLLYLYLCPHTCWPRRLASMMRSFKQRSLNKMGRFRARVSNPSQWPRLLSRSRSEKLVLSLSDIKRTYASRGDVKGETTQKYSTKHVRLAAETSICIPGIIQRGTT